MQLTVKGAFAHGLVIAGTTYKHFELREALLADMIDAEAESGGPANAIHYNAQLAVRQLVKVQSEDGQTFEGPFTVAMVRKRADFLALRKAQMELDDLGNADASGSATTGAASN